MVLSLLSDAFIENAFIPQEYTCVGANISPKIEWQNAPSDTESFALIMDDPDAPMGTWVHWIMFDIPSDVNDLNQDINLQSKNAKFGKNSWNKDEYGGPCPPSGTHRYFFKLYALDAKLNLPQGSTKSQLEQAMAGHILDQAVLMGKFSK